MSDPTSPIEAFRALATAFCAWCESDWLGRDQARQAATWLARLHAAALLLPSVGPEYEDSLPSLPPAHLSQAERNFRPFVGAFYRTLSDPDPSSTDEPDIGDVGDDLLDTYKDIKSGCLVYSQEREQRALWHWSFMHKAHWGRHAVGALAALQADNERRAP